jgi:hypothetical protein
MRVAEKSGVDATHTTCSTRGALSSSQQLLFSVGEPLRRPVFLIVTDGDPGCSLTRSTVVLGTVHARYSLASGQVSASAG